jgi:hypothetical protein
MFKVITILAQLCAFTAAVDCHSHPELSECIQDETSLLQVSRTISRHDQDPGFTFSQSQVEGAQDDLKAAQSNTSIQMYAQSQARLNEAQAIWKASKEHIRLQGATQRNVNAERAAAAAVQAAQDEADLWNAAVKAYNDQKNLTSIAEEDYNVKHELAKNASAALDSASANLTGVQDNAKVVETTEQMMVNDAAAEAAANYSLDAKVVAAARVATQKETQKKYDEEWKEAQAARKSSWKSQQKAQKDEWAAHKASQRAQMTAELAAAAAAKNQMITQSTVVKTVVSGLQTESTQSGKQDPATTVVVVVENTSQLEATQASASKAVQDAQYAIDVAVSDKKKAKAAYDVAKWAEYVAKNNRMTAQDKADAKYSKEKHLWRQAWQAAHDSRKALEKAKQLNWQLNATNQANATAWQTAAVAENITYTLADAIRNATDIQMGALANVTDAVNNATYYNAVAKSAADLDVAKTTAETAAVSRIGAEYDEAYEQAVRANLSIAKENLTNANVLQHDALGVAHQAHGDAVHAAWQAQKYDRKAAAVTLSNISAATDEVTVVSTETTQVLG